MKKQITKKQITKKQITKKQTAKNRKVSILACLMAVLIFVKPPALCLASVDSTQSDPDGQRSTQQIVVDAEMSMALAALFMHRPVQRK